MRESNIDEPVDPLQTPAENVIRIAEDKARAVIRTDDNAVIIGADTIVVLDGTILGKPRDPEDAIRMLASLSGREHDVFTGFVLIDMPSNRTRREFERTRVRFRNLGSREIREYVESGSPMDKAGAYGIQDDYGAVFVERIDGCFYNVVGFPLTKFYTTISDFNHIPE